MKKGLLFFAAVFIYTTSFAQSNTDTSLNTRLAQYLLWSKNFQFDKLINYIHPSLFTIAPRETILKSFEQTLQDEDLKIQIDSISVAAISATFTDNNKQYKKVAYYMQMQLQFRDTADSEDLIKYVMAALQKTYSGRQVTHNKSKGTIEVKGNDTLFAIKDNAATPWMFLGYYKDAGINKALFPKNVMDHFKLL